MPIRLLCNLRQYFEYYTSTVHCEKRSWTFGVIRNLTATNFCFPWSNSIVSEYYSRWIHSVRYARRLRKSPAVGCFGHQHEWTEDSSIPRRNFRSVGIYPV